MNETMHTTLTTLRAYVVALRQTYKEEVKAATAPGYGYGSAGAGLREQAAKTHARLSYLVPLYKAMLAVVQQAGTPAQGGVKKYTLHFEKFGALQRKVMPYPDDFDKYFDGDVSNLQVLVPVAGVPVESWDAVSISTLTAQMLQQVEDERVKKLNLAQAAETARKAFIQSLNAEQRAALVHALEAAKANRTGAIQLDVRDLSGL
jgi:hypothetical protein